MPMIRMIGAKPALRLFMASTMITFPSFPQEECGCRGIGLNRKFMKASHAWITWVSKIIGLHPRISRTFDLVADCVG
jgi:hypothetical protein